MYSGHESFIVYIRNETARGHLFKSKVSKSAAADIISGLMHAMPDHMRYAADWAGLRALLKSPKTAEATAEGMDIDDVLSTLVGLSQPEGMDPAVPRAAAGRAAGRAAAADDQGGGASHLQGGLGARRSIRKQPSPARLTAGMVVGATPKGAPPAAASGRRKKSPAARPRAASSFVGVSWDKQMCRWQASVHHDGSYHRVGFSETEEDAAKAFDEGARRLRPKGTAHGHRSRNHWLRLNFPSAKEQAYAAQQGMPTAEGTSAVTAKAAAQGFVSERVGVKWYKKHRRWRAGIWHDRKNHHLGTYDDEQEAARAFDEAARRLRPKGEAHGVLSDKFSRNWQRLNFPTAVEKAFAKGNGMPPPKKTKQVPCPVCKVPTSQDNLNRSHYKEHVILTREADGSTTECKMRFCLKNDKLERDRLLAQSKLLRQGDCCSDDSNGS